VLLIYLGNSVSICERCAHDEFKKLLHSSVMRESYSAHTHRSESSSCLSAADRGAVRTFDLQLVDRRACGEESAICARTAL
jgi:hypothetical protein